MFSLSFVSRCFLISTLMFSMCSWLFSNVLLSLHMFVLFTFFPPVIDFLFHSVIVGKNAWYDFNFLKFTEAWFVTQDMIYPGKCYVCSWEESVICCFWMECPINYQLNLSGLLCHLKLVFSYSLSVWMICLLV